MPGLCHTINHSNSDGGGLNILEKTFGLSSPLGGDPEVMLPEGLEDNGNKRLAT